MMAQKIRDGLQNVKGPSLSFVLISTTHSLFFFSFSRESQRETTTQKREEKEKDEDEDARFCVVDDRIARAQSVSTSSLFLCVRSRLEFLFQNTPSYTIERRPIKARAAKTTTKADAKTTLRDERTNERNEEQQQHQKCPRKRNSSGPG